MSVVSAQDNQTTDLNTTNEDVISLDQENNTPQTNNIQIETTIKAQSYTAYEGVKNTYKVELSAGDVKLSKKVIKFTLNGKTFDKTTNSKGEAKFDFNLPKGEYQLDYSFGGDGNYKQTKAK